MGRRPMGRKYPKHISIQVKEEHNEDFKLLALQLSRLSILPNGKTWTIRDIILTHLYAQYNNTPEWYVKNHFEKLSDPDLEKIRRNIGGNEKFIEIKKTQTPKPKQILKQKTEPKLKIKLDPNYANFQNKMIQIRQEDN